MSSRLPLLALLAVVVAWAALGLVRDRQHERYLVASQHVWIDAHFATLEAEQEALEREVMHWAGDDPEVQAAYAAIDSLNAAPNPAMDRQRVYQDSVAASAGAVRDPATGRLAQPESAGALADVPAGWFHGAFGAVAALLALVALTAPRR